MLTQTFRKGSELSGVEKANISTRMLLAQSPEEKDSVRESLCQQYGIGVSSVGALVAHETMRRKKNLEGVRGDSQEGEQSIVLIDTEQVKSSHTQTVQKATQARIYKITTLSELTEEMRDDILEEFGDVIKNNTEDSVYDYYQDIEVLSEYYNIEPSILKQFLKNRYNWLGTKLDELKKGKILIEEDKLSIRLYVEAGSDEKDKKVRRKEMAKQYRVSTFVIGAITAWKVDESGGVILKKDGIGNEEHLITETLNGKSSTSMVEVTTQTGKNPVIDLKEEQSLSDEDQAFIGELAGDFDLSNDAKRELFLQDVFDLFPDATIEDIKMIVSNFPDDTPHANIKRSGEGMGALVNYNNAIKNKWREKLKEFINAHTDAKKRTDMKVLCLPGIECLEIPLYLELGFRPENIIGVEAGVVKGKKDLEVIDGFQSNASRYGIQTRIGKLEKVLEIEDTVFDVVSLDFLGPFGQNTLKVLRQLKVSEPVLIMINSLGKRENSFDSNLMKSYYFGRQIKLPVEINSVKGNYSTRIQGAINTVTNKIEEKLEAGLGDIELESSRNGYGLMQILSSISIDMTSLFPDKLKTLHQS